MGPEGGGADVGGGAPGPARPPSATFKNNGRSIGNFGVPEHWGKKSKYTEGTDFLGTPADHLELTKKRPLSPDLFKVGTTATPHYKMPPAAISSIVNRVTGLAMTGGMTGLAVVALAGDPVAAIEAFKAGYPALVLPAKAGIAFPMVSPRARGRPRRGEGRALTGAATRSRQTPGVPSAGGLPPPVLGHVQGRQPGACRGERGPAPRPPSAPTPRPGGALTAAARPAAQVDPSFLDKQAVEKSSYMLFGASIAGSLYIALA